MTAALPGADAIVQHVQHHQGAAGGGGRGRSQHSDIHRYINTCVLLPGAATTDVIVQYVSTIKALREVDALGVLLEAIADPIREYLRSRKVPLYAFWITQLSRHLAGAAHVFMTSRSD